MHDDQHETDAPSQPQHASAEWVAPTLTDLGSFEELTKNNPTGTVADAEGQS